MTAKSPNIAAIALIVVGVAILTIGSLKPQYNDPDWHEKLYGQQWFGRYSDADAESWFALHSKLLTAREDEQDAGIAVAGLGIGFVAVFASARIRTWADLRDLRSPVTLRQFRWSAILVWLSFVPSAWLYYIYTSVRDDYSPMGDIITIPCAGVAVFGMVGLPAVVLGVNLATARRQFPVRLWTRPAIRWRNPVSWAVWAALLAGVAVLVTGILQMPPIVPSAIATLYLLLCGRAVSAQPAITLNDGQIADLHR